MRSLRLSFPIIVSALSSSVFCDGNHNHGHQRTGGLLGGGNNDNNNGGGGGGVSSDYGVPSGGYGAPSGGGGGVSSGYGAPSGGGGGSGYGAPSSGYGGGGGGAPVYVYQQDQGSSNDGGGGLAGGLLAALLPLGALALVGGLGLVTFGALFPATTVVAGGKRRRRSAHDNSTAQEQQLELLQNYMDTFDKMPEMNLHKDMVAKYLECGSGSSHSTDSPSLHGCLQKLNCIQNDKTVNLTDVERQVADIVIDSILTNEFVSKSLKKSIQVAGKKGFGSPGTCHVFKCHHHLLPQQYGF